MTNNDFGIAQDTPPQHRPARESYRYNSHHGYRQRIRGLKALTRGHDMDNCTCQQCIELIQLQHQYAIVKANPNRIPERR